MKNSKGYRVFTIFNIIIMILFVVVTLFPFLNIVAQSFSSESFINSGQITLWPKGFNIDTYKVVVKDSMFWINYKNTVIYTVFGTLISLFMTTIFAYALSKEKLRGRKFRLFVK